MADTETSGPLKLGDRSEERRVEKECVFLQNIVAQHTDFGLQPFELLLIAGQKVPCQLDLGADTTGRQQAGVGPLVVATPEVTGLDPAFVDERASSEWLL